MNERSIFFIILCVIMVAIGIIYHFISPKASASEFPTYYVSADSGLNCRTEPSMSGSIITAFPNGTELKVVGASGEWWEVWDGTTQGYCHSDYLSDGTESEPEVESSGDMTYLGDFYCTGYTVANGPLTALGDRTEDVVGYAIAVDPTVIPYNSTVYIEGIGYRVARDCGGAIKGNRLDVLVWDTSSAYALTGYRKVYLVN